jgi:hypothetical protein
MTRLDTVVARPPSTAEAHLIAGMLESYGIAARVSTDDAGGLEPQWQLTEGVRVLVSSHAESAARDIVANADATAGGD